MQSLTKSLSTDKRVDAVYSISTALEKVEHEVSPQALRRLEAGSVPAARLRVAWRSVERICEKLPK